jgi:hypothetical protein
MRPGNRENQTNVVELNCATTRSAAKPARTNWNVNLVRGSKARAANRWQNASAATTATKPITARQRTSFAFNQQRAAKRANQTRKPTR